MISPEKRAQILRPKLMKNGKYLIARIEGSGQEKSPKKIIETYFRWKQYIGHHTEHEKKWLNATLEQVWSPEFLGLDKNMWSKPIEQAKKLEFQNPTYSAAYVFNGDPRNYRRVFAVQISGCTFECNYCYVPPEVNSANPNLGKYFSAKEIVDSFISVRQKSNVPVNVLRITGGEPTIIPEIIVDIYTELERRGLDDVYLWNDTNLSTTKYLMAIEGDLKDILKRKNVGIVGCFKGVSKEDFSLITGCDQEFFEKQFESTKLFLDWGSNFYVYLPALIYGNDIEQKIRNFIKKLQILNRNLPLRTEVLVIKNYPGALLNMNEKSKQNRPMPKTDQRKFFDLWYNKLLPEYYSNDMLNKFCCQIIL